MKLNPSLYLRPATPFLLALALGTFAAEEKLDITKDATHLIPVALSGYTGEAASVLKFDLEVAGFKIVGPGEAQFIVTGKNNGQVEGRVTDRINKATIMEAKAYANGSQRLQAHWLADDIVFALTGKPGIAKTKIAFKGEVGKHSEIFIADYDGHNAVAVTRDSTIVAAPCWVPGRRILYYTSYKSGYPDIYSHDLSSGERRVFSRYPGLNTSAAVSPDGKRVAMILSKNGSPDLYVCNADGSHLAQLTKTREDESSSCWSPDGTRICLAARVNERRALYLVSASGGPMTRLRTEGVLNPTEPDWSPDGKTIVFTSQMGSFNICTVPASGGVAQPLKEGEDPTWAPNSRTVIFTRRLKDKRILSMLDVPTKQVKDVIQNSGSCSQPSWAK